ncbi:hypothetical protein B566_EDAN004515 [Ephemera danica]|nr:hypothetical protein B566_EDAN004515 [Ephemera danica]
MLTASAMVRGGTGLVGRAVAQFEAARRAGSAHHHASCTHQSSAGVNRASAAASRSLIPQPLREKAVTSRVELTEDEELARLRAELRELREHNELLEFRLLEKQSAGSDDVSDSGVSEDPLDRDHMERVLSLVAAGGTRHDQTSPQLLSPLSMHESGIFDTILIETETRATQTDQELGTRCEALLAENRRLDEERCELEEAENDARHISQRRWETLASQLEERNFELEESDVETRHKLASLEESLPSLLAFATLMARVSSHCAARSRKLQRCLPALPAPSQAAATQTVLKMRIPEVTELRARVQAYSETLRLADQLWADTERQYQSRLHGAEEMLTRLRERVVGLEEQVTRVRSTCCSPETLRTLEKRNEALQRSERRLQQHVHELEANEHALRDELRRVEAGAQVRERRLGQEAARARDEADEARTAAAELQRARDELATQLGVARKRCETLRRDVEEKHVAAAEAQAALAQEESRGRTQIRRAATLLAEAECTNSELREEVDTLEGCSRCGVTVQPEVREVASQLRALADIVSGEAHRRHSQCDSEPEEEEEEAPPVPPVRRQQPAGSRVRAVHRALLRASKPAMIPCPPPRPTELVAR